MTVTASMVKDLREKTGAGMMDCKKALVECDAEMEAAVDWLRAKGLSKAAKKADRAASEGLIGLAVEGKSGVIIELNSETDFVSRNDEFQKLVADIVAAAMGTDGTLEETLSTVVGSSGKSVADHVTDKIASIGENISLRRSQKLSVDPGCIVSYVHNVAAPNMGRIGVLVGLRSEADSGDLRAFGKQIAMHIAASTPLALSEDDLDADLVARERVIFTEQAKESGKPDSVIEKMVEGRIRKFIAESTLLNQPFVINPDLTVDEAVKKSAGELSSAIEISGFVRFAVGEGMEKEEVDFASEVAATAGI